MVNCLLQLESFVNLLNDLFVELVLLQDIAQVLPSLGCQGSILDKGIAIGLHLSESVGDLPLLPRESTALRSH